MELDFSPLDRLREGRAWQSKADQTGNTSSQKPSDAPDLPLGVLLCGQHKDTRHTGRLCASQGNFYDMAERELERIGEQIALLLKGVVDENAVRYYPDRDKYIKRVVAALHSRATYLIAYLEDRREEG